MSQNIKLQPFTIIYTFSHSKMGFNNSITIEALNKEQALEKAKKEIEMCYGSSMLKRFSFK